MAKAGFSDDVMAVIRAAAPTVGGILGSAIPIPGVGTALGAAAANLAVDALGRALGVEPKPEAINARIEKDLAVINANGSGALVKQADLNLALHRADDIAIAKINANLQVAQMQADNADRANARDHFANKRDWGQIATGASNVIMVGFTLWSVLTGLVDLKDPLVTGFIGIVIGHVFGWYGGQNNFFYGSSKGSQRNGDALRNELAKR